MSLSWSKGLISFLYGFLQYKESIEALGYFEEECEEEDAHQQEVTSFKTFFLIKFNLLPYVVTCIKKVSWEEEDL